MEKRKLEIYSEGKDRTLYYSNDMNEFPLGALSACEEKIFIVACYRYQQQFWKYFQGGVMDEIENKAKSYNEFLKEIPILELSFKELKKLSNYKKHDNKKFAEDLRELRMRLQGIAIEREYESSTATKKDDTRLIVFPTIDVLETKDMMTFTGNLGFIKYLFGFYNNYTEVEIDEIRSLKSKYSILCYMRLKQWKSTGCWRISYDDFCRVLDLSDSYTSSSSNIDKNVFSKVMKELSPFFKDLKMEKNHDKNKQGQPIKSIEFTFVPEKENEKFITCPVCGQPLYERIIAGRVCWAHSDGWKEDAPCHQIFNDVAEIKGYSENPERTEDEEEACQKIEERLSGMFGLEEEK